MRRPLRLSVDQFPIPVCEIGAEGLVQFNDGFAALFGYSVEELRAGVTLPELGLEALVALGSGSQEVPQKGSVLQLQARSRSGERRELDAYVARIAGRGERRLIVALTDATERRRAEEAFRESEERTALVLRATSNVIWDWDIQTDRILWNEVVGSAFRYRADEVEESYHWWLARVHPDDVRHVLSSLEQVLQGHGELWTTEYRFRRGDGSYATVLSRGYVQRGSDGTPFRVIGAMTDVTDHRQLEERFYQAQRMEAIGRLASGVAHDFNNVLMVIQGTTDLLLIGTELDESVRTDLLEIRKAAERATSLTRQLLAFGRRQVLRPEVVNLNGAIREMAGMLRRVLGEDIELVARLGGEVASVRVDRRQLEHAILNLASNARDAMPQGGRIVVETTNAQLRPEDVQGFPYPVVPGPYVRLSVEDTGAGMDADTLGQIFEPFFTTKGQGKGTGLGLATVYGFVKQSGGYIWATSAPGAGTRFEIYLPRTERRTLSLVPEAVRPELPSGRGTILLVEDETAVRTITRRILSRAGYVVLEASNGVEAWNLFSRSPDSIDVLLTDVVMPEMGGRELADKVLKVRPDLEVIYMSGHTDDRILRHGIGGLRLNFLQKPFRPEALLQKLRSLLEEENGP